MYAYDGQVQVLAFQIWFIGIGKKIDIQVHRYTCISSEIETKFIRISHNVQHTIYMYHYIKHIQIIFKKCFTFFFKYIIFCSIIALLSLPHEGEFQSLIWWLHDK